MARRAKKHHEEEEAGEAWLLPYSDLMTLLLAVFIVLFAVNKADPQKIEQMAAYFQAILEGGSGLLNNGTSIIDGDFPISTEPQDSSAGDTEVPGDSYLKPIDQLEYSFKTYVEENDLSKQIQLTKTEKGLLITLISDVWFPTGSATITQAQADRAKDVAAMIAKSQSDRNKMDVVIIGHTDNVPINTKEFKSNIHLSLARAVNFMEVLIDQSTLNPSNYSVRGVGEYEPIDTNDTPEGRQHNRRVEVFISPSEEK